MTWDKGWNFRASSPFVTDGTNETYSLGEAYPTTRNGVTFGWLGDLSANARDRDNTFDRREAGINFQPNNGTQSTFRADLSAAAVHNITLGSGDIGSDLDFPYMQVLDGATPLLTISHGASVPHTDVLDATDTSYSLAAWPTSNTPVSLTFTGTVFNLVIGYPAANTNDSMLMHLFISQVPPAGPPRLARIMAPQQRMAA